MTKSPEQTTFDVMRDMNDANFHLILAAEYESRVALSDAKRHLVEALQKIDALLD